MENYNTELIKGDVFTNTLNTKFDGIHFEQILLKYYDDLMSYKVQKFKTEEECIDYINKVIPLIDNISYWKNTKALMLYNLFDEEDKETRDKLVDALSKVDDDIANKAKELFEL